MVVWKLSPRAQRDDPHWQGYHYKRPLLVEAEGASAARLKATRWYKEQFQVDADKTFKHFYRSAFEDEKLYEIIRLMPESLEPEKQRFPLVT